jgi:RHS repeat-associated protein
LTSGTSFEKELTDYKGGNTRLRINGLTNPKYSPHKTTRRNFGMSSIAMKHRLYYRKKGENFTVKELDPETGLYYYGARYLDPKTGRWLSGDPAMGEYLPVAPVSDEAKKRNGNLPGQGGVFNYVNLHAYHYAGNNPVKYVDPDGKDIYIPNERERKTIKDMINSVSKYKYEINSNGKLYRLGDLKNFHLPIISKRSQAFSDQLEEAINSDHIITITIGATIIENGKEVDVQQRYNGGVTARNTLTLEGLDYEINSADITITGLGTPKVIPLKKGGVTSDSATRTLVHELTAHAIPFITGGNKSLDNENLVRREMNWPERANDEYHNY